MIPDFPYIIKIRLALLKKIMFRPDVAIATLQRQDATKKKLMMPILFLYYEESMLSSNLNSKLFRFRSAHPNQNTKKIPFLSVEQKNFGCKIPNFLLSTSLQQEWNQAFRF